MEKENGEASDSATSSGGGKMSGGEPSVGAGLLDAANLFGAYWPRTDAQTPNAASLFAAVAAGGAGAGAYGPTHLPPHLPFLPPLAAAAAAASNSRPGSGAPAFSPAVSSSAYTNTLSVAASQAASLGLNPAASAAWWSMASQLAAQDYLARLQASGLSFPGLGAPGDPYAALGLSGLGSLHKSSKSSSSKSNNGNSLSSKSSSKSRTSATALSLQAGAKLDGRLDPSKKPYLPHVSHSKSSKPPSLTIQPTSTPKSTPSNKLSQSDLNKPPTPKSSTPKPATSANSSSAGSAVANSSSASIFTSPLSLAGTGDRNTPERSSSTPNSGSTGPSTATTQSMANSSMSGLPSNILSWLDSEIYQGATLDGSDPSSILGGVRLPPDTEIIKYTSSIVGPKIPGTTNRGRKKTISLDPPSVSVMPTHSSTGILIERGSKWAKLTADPQDLSSTNDRVEVIKLPATNGSPSGLNMSSGSAGETGSSGGDAPLNLSLKPASSGSSTSNCHSNSLNSLSNLSANIGMDRISRRKPGPKPRRVIQPPSPLASASIPASPSASLAQLFAAADSPRPPSRNDDSISSDTPSHTSHSANHKDGRPRNLGRGVSKPKKNTVASLLAQSRALGIKPVQIDPNAPMNQQMSLLKSNILAAQQFMVEQGDDRFEKFRNNEMEVSTDSDNLTDSNQTDSEPETDANGAPNPKKRRTYNETELRIPLQLGWKRETVIRGLTRGGGIRGDVYYTPPDTPSTKLKSWPEVGQHLEQTGKAEQLGREHFTFSTRLILGDYLQKPPPGVTAEGEYLRMSEEDVQKRLEELHNMSRTNLAVEQRIDIARRQQAARAAARLDREQARMVRELERSEKQEAARRDREARTQQLMEAKRKRHEDLSRQKHEEQQRKMQEREMKKQQAAIIKEQMYIQEINKQREMLYTVELERERRRQHMSLVKALEGRRRLEERERKKQQALLEKQASKERRMEQRRIDMEILTELRKPCEDLELAQRPLPDFQRIPNLRLSGQAFADILMVFEFLHNFGETLGFDMESLPCLASLQQALLNESVEAEEELLSVMTHLLVCAIEDPGIPNPARHTTILGQSLRQADITHANISEILRIYLYANATGEVKALTGVHFERDREKRVADHHQNGAEMQITQTGRNATYYELLHENSTWRMSDTLKDRPFLALNPTEKAAMLAFLCNELLQNKAVIRQIEGSLENVAQLKKERWLLDCKIRKLRMNLNRKIRTEAAERAQVQAKLEGEEQSMIDSPALPHKEDLLVDEEEEISENESEGTQPEEEEDKKLSGEELSKKLDKLLKTSEQQLQSLNNSAQQLRATSYGQDRYWRRYWSLPTAGGVFVEAMESASPEILEEQMQREAPPQGISLDDIKKIIHIEGMECDHTVDGEVQNIVEGAEREEHRKTPNRNEDMEMMEIEEIKDDIKKEEEEKPKIFGLFEKLGECMEKENNKTETELEIKPEINEIKEEPNLDQIELIPEVKQEPVEEPKIELISEPQEVKPEIKIEVKPEIKQEKPHEEEVKLDNPNQKWFSIISRESITCEGVQMCSGNRWDTTGLITSTSYPTELKIPVFPPPNCQSYSLINVNCESPAPLQMSAEESIQLEYIKLHGPQKRIDPVEVPKDMRYGWWKIEEVQIMKETLDGLHMRGAREREMKRSYQCTMQSMYENATSVHIEEGNKQSTELQPVSVTQEPLDGIAQVVIEHGAPVPDVLGYWNTIVAERIDFSVLEQVEALEDKVANASMQVKGWKIPNRETEDVSPGSAVTVAKERLTALEAAIERRYLKPPLGVRSVVMIENPSDPLPQEQSQVGSPSNGSLGSGQQCSAPAELPDIPKGLTVWREAVQRCNTSAQLAMCLYMLEASIAWDKSIMKAVSVNPFDCLLNRNKRARYETKLSNCQFCHSGDNEDKLLLCDSCDKGYHTYCFRPKMETIPEGNWYCHECINKVTGERNCIVCGKKQSSGRLMLCDLCPRAYHQDCINPPMTKAPRGKWYCPNCHSKQPKKRNSSRRSNNKQTRDSESSDHPPASPAPSHSSVTTDDLTNQSTLSNQQTPTPKTTYEPASNQSQFPNSSGTQSTSSSPGGGVTGPPRKERISKKLQKELAPCKTLLEDLECHDDAWPFLLPVNTKQFPTYKKIITSPMDLSTIKKRLQDLQYKSREEFCMDVRQIFDNCETFNEDDSPVGKAGHCMRQFFEARWNELCPPHHHAGKS